MKQQYTLENNLKKHFNYPAFRTGQKEIIQDIMQGRDVLGVLPTGSGKSICYQLPAKLLSGTTIVVSPLISLMIDQVKQLKAIHFKEVVALNSFMEYAERREVYERLHTFKLIYVSPELLQKENLLDYLQQIDISLFVIDEAHCISQWGHEFRPDYLKLHSIIKLFKNPPILALSATATINVQADITTSLQRPNMIKHIYPMDRANITFCVHETSNEAQKQSAIIQLLSKYHLPTLIYFSSRRTTENIAKMLANKLPNQRIAFYHGGMEQIDRISIQQQFMNDQLDIICCTSAFGMGINKSNIRLVIHYHFPSQIESFIQEVGRAGRDGESSVSLLFYSKKDYCIPAHLIQKELPSETDLVSVFHQLKKIYEEQGKLPANEEQLVNLLQINETHWRFLHYQLEKHGIMRDNIILYEKEHWQNAFSIIKQIRKNRLMLKENKLAEMMQWMQQTECLRKHLYKNFQHAYTESEFSCCSNCGFTFADWKPPQTTGNENKPSSWKIKLKNKLLIGVSDETE